MILQSGFEQLESDRKRMEQEQSRFRESKKQYKEVDSPQIVSVKTFFKGVSNPLALKKRYKDLMKIFHPDNMCGDVDTVKYINEQYELLKKKIEY